jgi:hypothetical protein
MEESKSSFHLFLGNILIPDLQVFQFTLRYLVCEIKTEDFIVLITDFKSSGLS